MRHQEPMIMPWAKRVFARAAIAALLHSVGWAVYVYHQDTVDLQNLERRQAVINWLDWTKFGPGMQPTSHFNLYLKMQPLTPPDAAEQFLVRSSPRSRSHAYFERHRAGDVVDVWIDRRTGRIAGIYPPEAPDFYGLLRVFVPVLGTITFVLVTMILMWTHRPEPSPET